VGITHTDILLSWLEVRGPWRSLASRSSLAPSHASLVTTAAQLRIIFADTGSEQQSVKSA
jgi:hypothetical protein